MILYIMCGPSGSGKSTYANKLEALLISTDAIRKELFGDESVQDAGDKVFKLAYQRIEEALKNGEDVVFDATNLRRENRKKLIQIADMYGAKKYCICMKTTIEDCIERQKFRDRKVPEEVIIKQFTKLQLPTIIEGWDYITFK